MVFSKENEELHMKLEENLSCQRKSELEDEIKVLKEAIVDHEGPVLSKLGSSSTTELHPRRRPKQVLTIGVQRWDEAFTHMTSKSRSRFSENTFFAKGWVKVFFSDCLQGFLPPLRGLLACRGFFGPVRFALWANLWLILGCQIWILS